MAFRLTLEEDLIRIKASLTDAALTLADIPIDAKEEDVLVKAPIREMQAFAHLARRRENELRGLPKYATPRLPVVLLKNKNTGQWFSLGEDAVKWSESKEYPSLPGHRLRHGLGEKWLSCCADDTLATYREDNGHILVEDIHAKVAINVPTTAVSKPINKMTMGNGYIYLVCIDGMLLRHKADDNVGPWTQIISIPASRSSNAICYAEGYIFVFGTDAVTRINTVSRSVELLAESCYAGWHDDAVYIGGGKIVTIGWYGGHAYDIETNTWERVLVPNHRASNEYIVYALSRVDDVDAASQIIPVYPFPPPAIPRCASPGCVAIGKHKCGKCREVPYCSRECQRMHWPKHKVNCPST